MSADIRVSRDQFIALTLFEATHEIVHKYLAVLIPVIVIMQRTMKIDNHF